MLENIFAQVVELVDTRDLKSLEGNFVPVQVRLWAPFLSELFMYQDLFMIRALDQAKQSAAQDEVPIGCVITSDDEVISVGRNRCIEKQSPIRHAEIEAIESACKKIGNYRLLNTSIYITLEPCHMCCMAIVHARIKNLYFGAYEPKTGAVVSVDNLLDSKFLNHQVSYSGGHMADASSSLMRKFFKYKRTK